jgi:hypothetical protein
VSGQRWYAWLVELDLGLVLLAALLAGAGSAGPTWWRQLSAGLAAFAVGIAVILRWVNRASRRDKTWFDGRAVAESAKTASWRFMMRVEPFDGRQEDAEQQFASEIREILKARQDLTLTSSGTGSQITPDMREVRALRFEPRRAFYLQQRLRNQIDWYSGRAALHRRRATTWFMVGLLAELCALGWAIARIKFIDSVNLIGVFTSAAAGATAFGQLQRNDELARSYGLASQELQLIQSLVESAMDEAGFTELVKDSEGAISREHTMWVAKRT